jgi:heat shock protein HtpX
MTRIKTALLLAGLTGLFVLVGREVGGVAGLAIALMLALALNGIAYWYGDAIALQMAGARAVDAFDAPALHALVAELAADARLPMPRVYVIDEPSPNAFATGRDPRHAAVAVTTGLLHLLDRHELAGVIAHELAHIKNRDTLIATIAAVLAGAIAALADMAKWALLLGGGQHEEEERNPLVTLLLILVAPVAALLIQLAVSRQREFAADALGARITGDPLALASALQKLELGVARRPMVAANPALASLYIVNPFAGDALGSLFSTHPPIRERIARLLAGSSRPAFVSQWV